MPTPTKLHSTDFTLYALFCLSRLNLPVDAGALGRLSGRAPIQTAADLRQLERLGRVAVSPAGGVRLTLVGLARSAQLEPLVDRATRTGTARVARARTMKPLVAAKTRAADALQPAALSA